MKKTFRIAVLASTQGTDLQAIINEIQAGKMPGVELAVVASNKKNCYALQRAKEQGFDTAFVDPKGKTRVEFDQELAAILDEKQVDLIVLVGYMQILGPEFVEHFKWKIINVHPSLLPKYGGAGFFGGTVFAAPLKNNDKKTGMTIHFVTEQCDGGPIIHQEETEIEPDDTPESLKAKIQSLEIKWYPEVIRWLQHGKVVIQDE